MSLDVRAYKPGEKGKEIRRKFFWPFMICLIGVLTVLAALVAPRWLGYDRDLERKLVMVQISDAPDTRPQIIAGIGDKNVEAKLPDMSIRGPNNSAKMLLERVVDPEEGKLYANKFATIQNAEVLRVLDEDVIVVGSSPEDEIFVHIPKDVRETDSKEWGPQIEPKARVNVAGHLKLIPPPAQARELLRLSKNGVEHKPLAPVYVEATRVRLVDNKPLYGSD